jgi:ankyrin repeat protein
MVELLLANHADVNARTSLGETPLNLVLATEVVMGLLGAEVNAKSNAATSHLREMPEDSKANEVVKLLLSNHAEVNAKNKAGWTPLEQAAFVGSKDVAGLLLTSGAEVNAKNNKGETPLEQAAFHGYKNVVELLLANKADVNARDKGGVTPLQAAALQGHKGVVELLLANQADVNAKDDDGATPSDLAAANGHNDVVELLLQHGGQRPLAQGSSGAVTCAVERPCHSSKHRTSAISMSWHEAVWRCRVRLLP